MTQYCRTDQAIEDCECIAIDFQDALMFENIGTYWTMPAGKTLGETESEMWGTALISNLSFATAGHLETALVYADHFIALNPTLASIDFDRTSYASTRDFVHGIVSGFNYDDIVSFLAGERDFDGRKAIVKRLAIELDKPADETWLPARIIKAYEAQTGDTADQFIENNFVKWIPSKRTLERLHSQCDEKDSARTQQLKQPKAKYRQIFNSPLPGGVGAALTYIPG